MICHKLEFCEYRVIKACTFDTFICTLSSVVTTATTNSNNINITIIVIIMTIFILVSANSGTASPVPCIIRP